MRIPAPQRAAPGRTYIDLGQELAEAILKTVEAGWEAAGDRTEVEEDAGEIVLTECLRDGMREALQSRALPWSDTMVVLPGTESRSHPDMTIPDGRTDIPLFLLLVFDAHGEHDPHAIVECKRVAEGDAALVRLYVLEGIDRFKSGKYGANHAVGFMVGYVISGSAACVVDRMNRYLGDNRRRAERLRAQGGGRWRSVHARQTGGGDVTLHHRMLPVGKS